VFVVFLLWLLGTVKQRELQIFWSPLYIPALLLLLLGAAQLAFHLTLDWTSTREAFFKLSFDMVLFFLASQLLASSSRLGLRRFGLVVCVFTFLLSMFALLQLFSSHNEIYWSIPSPNVALGPYVNRNHYAGLMEMQIPVAASYVASEQVSSSLRLLLGFMVLVPVVSLLISGSRGGFLALCGETLIAACILWRRVGPASRRPLVAVAVTAIVLTVAIGLWLVSAETTQRFAETLHIDKNVAEPSIATRLKVSRDSLRIWRDHPWIGTGMGSFEVAFPPYQSFPSDLFWDHAHNDYAEALAETGLAGGLLIAVGLTIFFRLALRELRWRSGARTAWIRFGAMVGCCGMLIHSLVDFNLHLPANAAWFVVLVAIACGGGLAKPATMASPASW